MKIAVVLVIGAAIAACTIHPQGEREAREAAMGAGAAYKEPFEKRTVAVLPENPTAEDLVNHALLSNADLEAKYWQWRAALEQVPQAGTQKAGLEISFETMITNGSSALADTTLAIGNDAMNSLMLPSKLRTEAGMALHDAQATARRFDKARWELRNKVLTAYYNYALTAELIRLEQSNSGLLELMGRISESRVSTNAAAQTELLKSANETEMSKNQAQMLQAKLEQERAALNTLLGRAAGEPLKAPEKLPVPRSLAKSDEELLQQAAQNNPELAALAHEIAGKGDAIKRAKLEYLPDFNVNFGSDLEGMTQTLFGSVVLPYLRYQAIDAGIRQQEANLRAAQAMQRQTSHDLAARVVGDLSMMRDAQRQADLYQNTLIPRAERIVTASQNTYASGGGMLIDLLDAQRSTIALSRMLAELRIEREKQIADLEEATGEKVAD